MGAAQGQSGPDLAGAGVLAGPVLAAAGRRRERAARAVPAEAAAHDPVAQVALSLGLAHLDRLFDYLVPASLDEQAQPGVRVKVRFAGREVPGFIVRRCPVTGHAGRLEPVRTVVSPEPVLTPQIARLARELADAQAGTLDDVLRLAIPPRHATAERALPLRAGEPGPPPAASASGQPGPPGAPAGFPPVWNRYQAGPSFLARLAAGDSPAAAWTATGCLGEAHDWPAALAEAAAATLASGRGVVLVVPSRRDADRADAALRARLGPGRHVRLTADQGPQARYTAWLKVLRGHVRCVVGTRAAAYAPVRALGLVAWWADEDELHAEPRAPYPHTRDVLRARRRIEGCALLAGGFTRTTAIQAWLDEGWIHPVHEEARSRRRQQAPVAVAGEGGAGEHRDGPGARARLASLAWRTAKQALEHGPVLVQVPRRGYIPGLACQECGLAARCPECGGPLALPGPAGRPACRWCGAGAGRYQCPDCGSSRLRATVVGAERTAEELGRAFPGVPVRFSGGGNVLDRVPAIPALVVATPGAEPVAEDGYAATVLVDAWAALGLPRLDAGEIALARWLQAAALTRSRAAGGRVVLTGVPQAPALSPVEALVRAAPEWFAGHELAERSGLRLPPQWCTVRLSGPLGDLGDFLAQLGELPPSARVLGPRPLDPAGGPPPPGGAGEPGAACPAVALLTCLPGESAAVMTALAAERARRSARRLPPVMVRAGSADLD